MRRLLLSLLLCAAACGGSDCSPCEGHLETRETHADGGFPVPLLSTVCVQPDGGETAVTACN